MVVFDKEVKAVHRFFDPVIEPLLDVARPKVIIEIGSDDGENTERLAAWCKGNDAFLYAIDPDPKFEPDKLLERWGSVLQLHLATSLDALQEIEAADFVCIDGDHNWYTVFNELALLRQKSSQAERPFPITLLHDVCWPYGRRDLYYEPSRIPVRYRQEFGKGGIAPGRSALLEYGFNDHLFNSQRECTPLNGVATAIEDFISQEDGDFKLAVIPALHGLGILTESTTKGTTEELVRGVVDDLLANRPLLDVLRTTERERAEQLHRAERAQRKVDHGLTRIAALEGEVAKRQQEAEGLASQLGEVQAEVEETQRSLRSAEARAAAREAEKETLAAKLRESQRELRSVVSERNAQQERRDELERKLRRLSGRRSVKVALLAARLMRPIFRVRRGQATLFRHEPTGIARTVKKKAKEARLRLRHEDSAAGREGKSRQSTGREHPSARQGPRSLFHEKMELLFQQGTPEEFEAHWRECETALGSEAGPPGVESAGHLISVIMPTHNRAHVIGEAIKSVTEQEYENWELLICDDGSTDGTADVVERFGDPRIRYFRIEKSGAAAARNAALGCSRGSLIAYLDSDNLWHPKFLTYVESALRGRPGYYSVYCRYVDVWVQNDTLTFKNGSDIPFDYESLQYKNYVDLSCFAHRRALYEELGGFNESLARQQDWELLLRYCYLRDPVYVAKTLMMYRRNRAWNQITDTQKGDMLSTSRVREVIEHCNSDGLERPGLDDDISVSIVSWDICRNHFGKAYNLAEALSSDRNVQLLGYQFFDEGIFAPYADATPSFRVDRLEGGRFPEWGHPLTEGVLGLRGDVVYAVKPRLPSLGLALLANYHFGTPIAVEINDLESAVERPDSWQQEGPLAFEDVDPRDPALLEPHGRLWTRLMEGAAERLPYRASHNSWIEHRFGAGSFFVGNPKDESYYDPSRYDRDETRAKLGFEPDDRVLLFAGTVRRHKGVMKLVERLGELPENYKLLLVGSRESPELKELSDRALSRVVIPGTVSEKEMPSVTMAADVVVLWLDPEVPASWYQMPFKLSDAFAMQIPVVANTVGDLEYLERIGCVRNVPYGDLEELVRALFDLLCDPGARSKQTEAARRVFMRRFSYSAVRANMSLLIREAVSHPGTLDCAADFAHFFAEFQGGLKRVNEA